MITREKYEEALQVLKEYESQQLNKSVVSGSLRRFSRSDIFPSVMTEGNRTYYYDRNGKCESMIWEDGSVTRFGSNDR